MSAIRIQKGLVHNIHLDYGLLLRGNNARTASWIAFWGTHQYRDNFVSERMGEGFFNTISCSSLSGYNLQVLGLKSILVASSYTKEFSLVTIV